MAQALIPLPATAVLTAHRGPAPPTTAPAAAAPPPGAPPHANPQLRIDPALNLVVLEFRGADGALRHSLPTTRELDAYRQGIVPEPPRDFAA